MIDTLLLRADPEVQNLRSRTSTGVSALPGLASVPVFYVREDKAPNAKPTQRLPHNIAVAVHTSHRRTGRRFLIAQPSTSEYPDGSVYSSIEYAVREIEAGFTPRIGAHNLLQIKIRPRKMFLCGDHTLPMC